MCIPSKSDCLYPFNLKSLTLVNSAKCVLAIATFVPCVDVAVIGLLGSRSPAELCSLALRQSFRTNFQHSQGHNWGPARHESAQLHGLCSFITAGLKNTNNTAENQALRSAGKQTCLMHCDSISLPVDQCLHRLINPLRGWDLTTQLIVIKAAAIYAIKTINGKDLSKF